jgi:hypothetical protein
MTSRGVRERARRDAARQAEKARGVPASVMRLSSYRTADALVAAPSHLPCVPSAVVLQDGTGAFYALAGYSKAGGSDIGA